MKTEFHPVRMALADLLGEDYGVAVRHARAALSGESRAALAALFSESVDFFPADFQKKLIAMLDRTGQIVCDGFNGSASGASTQKFNAATRPAAAPLSGMGYFRVGESGRLYLTSKSEHYHAPLGHGFPGYRLVEHARRLGIPNATHNNTRGHITRLLEEELIRTANGIDRGDARALRAVIDGNRPDTLNRVLNLETGSLAVEAALKMILARFYRSENNAPEPPYAGRTPVIIVVGNDDGQLQANYHGTTMITQTFRDMWPEMRDRLEDAGILMVRAVRPNRIDDVKKIIDEYDTGKTKVAGFFHEIVMMNYGGRLLTPDFLAEAYALCRAHDIATVDDEIQSCMWHHELYMFREWGLTPDFVAVGKGFPGGEYAASRLLFNARFDTLPQFGALVTNGQEELASLTYLITMAWALANADVTRRVGDYFENRLRDIAAKYPDRITGIEGRRHLCAIRFADSEPAKAFAATLNAAGMDISVQTYKASCPPAALVKLPLIAGDECVDMIVNRMNAALADG